MTTTNQLPQDNPPPYDTTAEASQPYGVDNKGQSKDVAPPAKSSPIAPLGHSVIPVMTPGPSYIPHPHGCPTPNVYHYVNPRTGEQVASLLPPDHPEMVCLQAGEHLLETKFGLLGILAAVIWFPLGIGLCLLDRRVKCRRCGAVLDDGICG